MASSRIPGFYQLSPAERREHVAKACDLTAEDLAALEQGGLPPEQADTMIENVVGRVAFPLGVATNFIVNGVERLVPMAIEEPSVVAAASHAAKLTRPDGFVCTASEPVMIGQIQLRQVPVPLRAAARIEAAEESILADARQMAANMVARGGGPKGLQVRVLENDGNTGMIVVHLLVDCRDSMGANLVNSLAEHLTERLEEISGGTRGLRILSNLSTERMVEVSARVAFGSLGEHGRDVAEEIVEASRFATIDPYRAATHNKGVMNGVDAVLLATLNDWRGVEAGAHAYAARTGRYLPLALWQIENNHLAGRLQMPLAAGTVGGAVSAHNLAKVALKIAGADSAATLAAVAGAAGLATNLAALRALAKEGIQQGHMPLHHRKSRLTEESG